MNTNLETGWGEQKGTKKMNEANEQHKGFQKKKKKNEQQANMGLTLPGSSSHPMTGLSALLSALP